MRATCFSLVLYSLVLVVNVLAAVPAADAADRKPSAPSAEAWVDATLDAMTLEEKAAQMMMVRAYGYPLHPNSWDARQLRSYVRDLKVGGVCVFASEVHTVARMINGLQEDAKVPLIIAADVERGMAFRLERGAVPLPYAMAFGATRDASMARFAGEVTAREARALGIHWAFAPVVDVNVNPRNPVIHVRSYGEDVALVSTLAAAYVEGVHAGGLLATAKHFPGHGDTEVDSHLALPTITVDRERLDAVELEPFRRVIQAGVDAIMIGHLAVPAIDPSLRPASMSPPMVEGILRGEMGFDGLVVTDAMGMRGVGDVWIGAATVRAVQAGADVVALPPDPRVAVQSLVRAVAEGELTEERIDASVRRILATKARLGLHQKKMIDLDAVAAELNDPKDFAKAMDVARASITVVRNDGGVLPLDAREDLRILHVTLTETGRYGGVGGLPLAHLRARGATVLGRTPGTQVSPESADEIVARADEMSHVVISAIFYRGAPSPAQRRLLWRLQETGKPVIVVSLGSPYLLREIPEAGVYVATYGHFDASARAAVEALYGQIPVTGKLPVSLPGLNEYGDGLEIPRLPMDVNEVRLASAPDDIDFSEVDRTVESFVNDKAFPGAVLAVGYRGDLVHLQAYGRLSYDEDAAAVRTDTIYDLASLTKVVATTTVAMILVDEGRLNLDAKVQSFLPLFQGQSKENKGKEKVTVRHLLTHSSGIDWWAPLYERFKGKKEYVEHIQGLDLVYEPGTQTKYSDLGIILLGEILERVSGRPLEEFVHERIFRPLGMDDTSFFPSRPDNDVLEHVAPTERDDWRGRMVHGEVHDENAFAMGGVAPHAGLFSTAPDLARFVQMLVNGGVYDHKRIVSRSTVEAFTKKADVVEGATRAIGWDTPSAEGSSAGTLLKEGAFGHTGFTGTSIWVDPQRELFIILLTNRVHPTRDNKKIRAARPAIADAVVRALPEEKPRVEVGLERLAEDPASLQNKKLGLVVHAASVDAGGRHAIDVLREAGLDVVRLFSPEHGLRGRAAAGEKVDDGVDEASGLDVVSLYGEKRQPSAETLQGLDALVFDLQGAGVRFYTYVSTMMLCLDAAADAGVEFVVLDRPNPLGGERIEGPVSAPRDMVKESFVNMAPGPLVHGLTMGEMATYVNERRVEDGKTPAALRVVPMSGWKRTMTWADTGRTWISPSPNLRSADAALAYPGVGLLEATNLSEGRGTAEPFLFLGAPGFQVAEGWSSGGFDLVPVTFTPLTSPAAPAPKYLDTECSGLRVEVRDPSTARGYALGIELLTTLSDAEGFEWRNGGASLAWLLGTPRVLADLRAGRGAREILAADLEDHAAWRVARRPALLY